ncbi:uncharacterized protein LACBIDRAFT_325255 [Laccaria bicolor S238N-H82]|uniref:Predicted protein n=1 Tax=Laccaria bicolor (strain S238N-H82 / ATCC MYA-4686) TaxID=486041 RepID=B0D4C0_LACBS|nr:uncharacterized protein LACBIDRAFT_325255 [Laccaria bicolor S238N-H82]EDR10308.1 predicted protein [Laccaria bicolor S238N-H82]|eukprot:XP_001878758.1 predicted protein [Laccaria bicolor S238N-H82]
MSKLGLGASGKETRMLTSLTVESFSWARMSAHAIGSVVAVITMAHTVQSDLETENDSEALKTSLLDGQKATLANELPAELLVHIFETAQKMFFPLDKHMSWRFPFVLGNVSRYRHQVAYGAPTLWSNVDISLLQDLGGLQVCLSRSKDSPIDLNITFTPAVSQRDVSTLIGILQPHYRRCRSIRVKSDSSSYEFHTKIPSILGSMCQGHYPMLQHICVEGFEEGFDISVDLQPFAIVADAVNLTSTDTSSHTSFPLTAVTQLHLAPSNYTLVLYTDFSNMLWSCRSLVTLCAYNDFIVEWPTDPIIPMTPMTCPSFVTYASLDMRKLLNFYGLTIAPIVSRDLRGETSDTPRFPVLKSLTLAPAYVDSNIVDLANACFPGIKLLILPNYDKLSDCFKMTDSRPFWPELDGLAVRDIHDQASPTFGCALALAVPGSLVNIKNDPNGLAKGSIVGGGRSMEDTT